MNKEKTKNGRLALLLILIAFFSGCIFSSSDKKNGKKPDIFSINIKDGEIITTRDLTITWKEDARYEQYQYSFNETMYDWTDSTYVSLTDLDETDHIFTLQARKDTVLSSVTTINFTIDAIQGPGIVLSPRKISDNSYVTIRLEDVTGLMAAHIEIVCEDECASITEFTQNNVIIDNGQTVFFSNESDQTRFILDIGFGGAPEGINGSFDIGNVLVSPLNETGEIIIDTEKTEFRDFNNNTIEINELDWVRIEK